MPGENYAIVGCSNNRWHKDTTLFKLPTANPTDETNMSWRKAVLNVITRDKVVHSDLQIKRFKKILFLKLHLFEKCDAIKTKYRLV